MSFFSDIGKIWGNSRPTLKMREEINKVGGVLHFTVNIDERDGWVAECREFPSIITGGPNSNPSDKEVLDLVIDSVKTAFDVPTNFSSIKDELKIKSFTKELELCMPV